MKKKLFSTIVIISLFSVSSAFAQQNLRSAYFLDGYTYRYTFNPAFASERSFFSPIIGNTSLGVESNVPLTALFYPDGNGKVNSFMSSNVPAEEFLGRINSSNEFNSSASVAIASGGFWTGKLFHTIELRARNEMSATIPYDIFSFMKSPDLFKDYDISNIYATDKMFTELSYGISGSIADVVRIGARAKFLIGLNNMDFRINNATMTATDTGQWIVTSEGTFDMYGLGPVTVPTKGELDPACTPLRRDQIKFTETYYDKSKNFSFAGYGAAFDLGISATFAEYFSISAAVLDLGFLSWNNHMRATDNGITLFDGFKLLTADDSSAKNQYKDVLDQLDECFPFTVDSEASSSDIEMLKATVNASFEAKMPFYDRLSFGLLGTTHIDRSFNWYEGRIFANVAPVDIFSISTNYAYSNFGSSLGLALCVHSSAISFYVGADSLLPSFKWMKGVSDSKLNTNVSLGMNINFGEAHR